MSSSNNNRFIIEEKIKELKLSEEEQAAFRKAKLQIQNHSRVGALAGLLIGGYISRVRKFTLGASVFLTLGSIAIGSQIGFFTGTAAGIRTVKSLPNSQRIFDVIRDVQNFKRLPPKESRKDQEVEQQDDQSNISLSDDFEDNQDYNNNDDGQQSSWGKFRPPSTPSQDGSSWDKIRAQNSTSTTWDKIRQKNQIRQQQQEQQQQPQPQQRQQRSTSDRNNDGYSDERLPRTKEDFEELYSEGKIRTNQYGDVEIRYE